MNAEEIASAIRQLADLYNRRGRAIGEDLSESPVTQLLARIRQLFSEQEQFLSLLSLPVVGDQA